MEPETAIPTEEEFKERFPGAEQAAPNGEGEGKPEEIPTTRLHACSDGKHRNDEQYEIYKKYEERLELKKVQFKKDPDQFVHVDDIVMGVVVGDKSKGCIFGRFPLEECKAAFVTMQYRFFNAMTEMDYAIQMKDANKGIVGVDGKPVNTPAPGKIIT